MSKRDELLKEIGLGLETLAGRIDVTLATTELGSDINLYEEAETLSLRLTLFSKMAKPVTHRSKPELELLQGYTLEQWRTVIDGGYLCQFRGGKATPWTLGTLRTASSPSAFGVFVCYKGAHWLYCRPAQIPGVLRPWFGGDCPVSGNTVVIAKLQDGSVLAQAANTLGWGRGDNGGDIIAYMGV